MPASKPEKQAVWPKGTDVTGAHKARAAALKAKKASYTIEYTTEGGKKTPKEIWFAAGKMPIFMERSVTKSDKPRASQRPSKQARAWATKVCATAPTWFRAVSTATMIAGLAPT